MAWLIKFDGVEFNSDDLTIEELGAVETISDTPWSLANPIIKLDCAKAFLSVAMMRQGIGDDVIAKRLSELTLKEFKNSFEYVPDSEPLPATEGQVTATDLKVSTIPQLSAGLPKGSHGSRAKPNSKK